ncbi:MAG: biopolymer transporter ExbD [Breznakibacter sp.]|nr:biopolymer transporter ExbD [Breznakibacter sp.]
MAKRATPEVNAGSMADIAFLLLIFFLMTTTMDTDTGLPRMLPPMVPAEVDDAPPINQRNVFVVLINAKNQLLVQGQYLDMRDLKEKAKEFIENPLDKDDLPAKDLKEVPFFGEYPISKGVISLQNDRGTQYQQYLTVQNELQLAYTELRETLAQRKFSKKFAECSEEEQEAIKQIYPQRISEAEPKNIGGKK